MRRAIPLLLAGLVIGFTAQTSTAFEATDDGWIVECPYSHSLPSDPIVYPGLPGAAHDHDFFGAEDADAFSTADSMRRGGTRCGLAADTAGYWLPALMRDGRVIRPEGAGTEQLIYYRNDLDPSERIHVPPPGLRMVAGNSHAKTEAQNPLLGTSKIYFNCNDGEGPKDQVARPPVCDDGILVVHVRFPQCWDGVHLDSPDHISHMAWTDEGDTCPASHPVAIPRVTIRAEYPVGQDYAASDITLSSGPYASLHGDFLNTWHEAKLRSLVHRCFGGHRDCGTFHVDDRRRPVSIHATHAARAAAVAPARADSAR
jgi:Domain of unknown function (DUF1996)